MPPRTPSIIPIHTASRRYDAVIGADLLHAAAARITVALPAARAVHVFADAGLPPAVAADLTRRLDASGLRVSSSTVRPTENCKVLQTLYHLLQRLGAADLSRQDCVIALGGGIVGDMAGFAAASYRRGVPWVNCPTTLLSMVDASVGGKTGVNLRVASGEAGGNELQKNMVGAFWQPSLVLADVSTLASLDERMFRSGLAECIKHGLISADWDDPHLMRWTKDNLGTILAREPEVLVELIARNIAIKARVVGTDEREESSDPAHHGGRALLNLGHTFGHAIETLPMVSPAADRSLAPLQHGEAVALGLICAARCAEILKLVGDGLTESVRLTLQHAGLPTIAHHLPASSEVYERMWHDKKVAAGQMRLVLPCGEGRCRVVAAPAEEVVLQAVEAVRA